MVYEVAKQTVKPLREIRVYRLTTKQNVGLDLIYACTTLQIAWCINHCFLSHEWRDRDVPQVEVVENASSLLVLHTCWPVHIHSSRFLAVASQRHAVVWSCRAVALPLCEAAVARCCRYNNGNNGNNGISVANNGTSLVPIVGTLAQLYVASTASRSGSRCS